MQQITIEQATKLIETCRKHGVDLDDDQLEVLDKLEWATNNAKKLRYMFFGQVDQCSMNDMGQYYITLAAKLPDLDSSPSRMVH